MALAGITYWVVFVAATAGWIVGALWYRALARPWMIALGKTRSELADRTGKVSPIPFVVAFLAQLVMAWVLAGIVGQIGPVTLLNGIISGLFAWLGFVITTLSVNHAFARQRVMLTLIDGGHWFVVLVIQGALIGLLGR